MLWSARYPGIHTLIFHSCWSQRQRKILQQITVHAIVMCLVARNYGCMVLHKITEMKLVVSGVLCRFVILFVTFCKMIITHIAHKIKTYFSKNTHFVYLNKNKRRKGDRFV